MKIIETIFNVETQETNVVERNMTIQEKQEYDDAQAKKIAEAEASAAALVAKQAAEAKLAALGLTPADLTALGL